MASPPPDWISRSQAIARLGMSLSTFRRRVGIWKLREQVLQGEYFYLASEIEERHRFDEAASTGCERSPGGGQEEQANLTASDMPYENDVPAQPRSGSDSLQELGVNGVICGKVYTLLEQGKSRVDIVRQMSILPRVADAIASEWERQRRVVSITFEAFCKIKQLATECNCEEEPIESALEALLFRYHQYLSSEKEYGEFYHALRDLGENYILVEREFAPTKTAHQGPHRAVCDLISDAWDVVQPNSDD